MNDVVRDADGREVGRITESPHGWQVLINYDRPDGTSQKLLTDPETGDSYFPQASAAKKVLDRHIAGLCVIQGELEKRGTE